jgi:hypothetical protein
MQVEQLPYRNAPYAIMLAGCIFILLFPMEIDCCPEFQGWLQMTPLFSGMIKRGVITVNQIRSFEIELYVYLFICIVSAIAHNLLNGRTMLANASLRGDSIPQVFKESAKGLSLYFLFMLSMSLFSVFFPIGAAAADQRWAMKNWFLLRAGITGTVFSFGWVLESVIFLATLNGYNSVEKGSKK